MAFERVVIVTLLLVLSIGCNNNRSSPSPSIHDDELAHHPLHHGGSTQTATQPMALAPSPLTGDPNFQSVRFAGSGICANCHDGLVDHNGQNVSLGLDWASTMMAQSARDPYFRAQLASATKRNPSISVEIEKKCSRCHTPMASVEASENNDPVSLTNKGFFDQSNKFYNAAVDGVSCSLCHQIEDPTTAADGIHSGNFTINRNKEIYGPFESPNGAAMISQSRFTPRYAPYVTKSAMCGTCHDLLNDVLDVTGKKTAGQFAVQTVFTEWQNSQYATGTTQRNCQYCHMPETSGVIVANGVPGLSPRNEFSRHAFVGGNTLMLDVLSRNKTALGITANNFETTIARTRESLASAASVLISSASNNGANLEFTVLVRNNTGHKLPSGYPSRRAYLHVTIRNSANTVVFESGKLGNDRSIVEVDSDQNPNIFEPHYDVISSQQQVQVYEAIPGNDSGNPEYDLQRASRFIKDNRLLPLGALPGALPAAIKPDTRTLQDSNFTGGADEVVFRISGLGAGPFNVDAEFNYQPLAYPFLQNLFLNSSEPAVNVFKSYLSSSPITYETIAKTTALVP